MSNRERNLSADEASAATQVYWSNLKADFITKADAGELSSVESVIAKCGPEPRELLLVDLLRIEIAFREQRGESVEISELLHRFPNDKALIEQNYAMLIGSRQRANSSTIGSTDAIVGQDEEFHSGLVESGDSLGRYQLIKIAGTGSFGEVWKAKDPKLARVVAVKTPRAGVSISQTVSEQFVAEGRKAAQLDHPNIVTVYDAGIDDDRCYIVSQYVDGGTLQDRIRQAPMPIDEAVGYTIKLAEALHYAHTRGIVHRDMKPGNVLMTKLSEPLIADFGLAKLESSDLSILQPGQIAGTPAYMAPEQVLCGSRDVDARTDIFALGIILNEMLTRLKPTVGSSPKELRQYHERAVQLPLPSEHREDVPSTIDRIFAKATSQNVEARYLTAEELAIDLRKFQGDQGLTRIYPQTEGQPQSTRRSRWNMASWLLAIGILGAALAGIAAVVYQNEPIDDGLVAVRIVTRPEGAEVTFIRLKSDTGFPLPSQAQPARIVTGKDARYGAFENLPASTMQALVDASPSAASAARLRPGQYLVVVVWGEKNFHEVIRTVPDPELSTTKGAYKHMFWRRCTDGTVWLPTVELIATHDVKSLIRQTIPTFDKLDVPGPQGKPMACRVPAFDLAKSRIRWSHYVSKFGKVDADGNPKLPPIPAFLAANEATMRDVIDNNQPLVCIPWNEAMVIAEKFGMRLPHELELESVARQQMSLPVDERTIHGLAESPGLWTVDRAVAVPVPVTLPATTPGPRPPTSTMSSFSDRVIRQPVFKKKTGGYLMPREVEDPRTGDRSDVGIWLVKSVKPRLHPDDFIQPLQSSE